MEVTNSTFFENDALKFNDTFGGAIYVEGDRPCVSLSPRMPCVVPV